MVARAACSILTDAVFTDFIFLLDWFDEVEVKGLGDEVVGTDFLLELSLAGCYLLVEFLGGDRLFRTDGITDDVSQGAVIH